MRGDGVAGRRSRDRKSRLVDDLTALARGRGFEVAVGRCSQDDGAPPLWPWRSVLAALTGPDRPDGPVPPASSGDAGTGVDGDRVLAFRTWESLVQRLTARAAQRPVLVVFEDLHCADTASLRALRHLAETLADPSADRAGERRRLAVVLTRRRVPEPTGALAELGELLARRHAERLDLVGLPTVDAAELVGEVAGRPVPAALLERWQDRSGGNPFFLVELARAGTAELPASLRDVILGRVRELPADTQELLLLAAALGRSWSLELLAAVAGRGAGDVDEALEPARTAGLLVDAAGVGVAFAHALGRDALERSTSATRFARLHARVAHALQSDPAAGGLLPPDRRVAELARHWLAAGPAHVSTAWRAAVDAAAQARTAFAHPEAAALMRAALDAHRRSPDGHPDQRFDLLLTLAADCQRAADWTGVVESSFEAIALARDRDTPAGLARPAAALTTYSVWLPHEWNEVFADTVEDLRWAAARLGDADSVARCQVMLALAVELYYDPAAIAERAALVDEGTAMARRLGDDTLLAWATRAAWIASWIRNMPLCDGR